MKRTNRMTGTTVASGATIALAGMLALHTAAIADADAEGIFVTKPGVVAHVLPDGSVLWRAELPGEDDLRAGDMAVDSPDGRALITGASDAWLIDASGRLEARLHGAGRALPAGLPAMGPGECPDWQELASITPPPPSGTSSHLYGPVVDSAGDAAIFLRHIKSGDESLHVHRSIGHSGQWHPAEVPVDSMNFVFLPQGDIDQDDNITVVFRNISGGYWLYAVRYEPKTGWSDPEVVHHTSDFFQAVEITTDAEGRVIAVFDPSVGGNRTVHYVVYDPATGEWSDPDTLISPTVDTRMPTLERSPDGSTVYLAYRVVSPAPGLYAHRWLNEHGAWGAGTFLPDSSSYSASFIGPATRLNLAVGGDGEATIFWQELESIGGVNHYTVFAQRTENGQWQPPHELLPQTTHSTNMENFARAYAAPSGDVLGTITRFEGTGNNRFWAFNYDHDERWREPANPYTSALNTSTRVRGVYYQGRRAIATLHGSQDGQTQLTSLRSTATGWLPDLINIPGQYIAFFQELLPDQNEAVLVFKAESGGSQQGMRGSWLENVLGDLNCDGSVGVPDLLILINAWGACPDLPADCPADLTGDGTVGVADLIILISNWG